MPWKVSRPMDERMKFVARLEDGERMTDLCEEFGISRKTGYKFLERYRKLGAIGLEDGSHVPGVIRHRVPEATRELVLKLKGEHSSWGPKKLRVVLEREHPGLRIPSPSTIGELLKRHGLVKARRARRQSTASMGPLQGGASPNDLWCVDFKGQFRLGNGRYCYPLTLTDHYSRFVIACEALESCQGVGVLAACEGIFRRFGLPSAIRSDNGSPFASVGLRGLSRVSVWWMRLGIRPERIEPGHPEQNGRHERMHLTLKVETTRPAAAQILQQQERFDRFQEVFNHERPHEALGMKRPGDLYVPSTRPYPEALPVLSYPLHDVTRVVMSSGHLQLFRRNRHCYLGSALAGQRVGLREVEVDRWLVSFMDLDLALIDGRTGRVEPLDAGEDEVQPCS